MGLGNIQGEVAESLMQQGGKKGQKKALKCNKSREKIKSEGGNWEKNRGRKSEKKMKSGEEWKK